MKETYSPKKILKYHRQWTLPPINAFRPAVLQKSYCWLVIGSFFGVSWKPLKD
jgi:hypothetical protein